MGPEPKKIEIIGPRPIRTGNSRAKSDQNQVFMGIKGQNGISTTILVLTNLSKLSYFQLIMTRRIQSLVALKILGATRFSKTIYGPADH